VKVLAWLRGEQPKAPSAVKSKAAPSVPKGGRPKADWWDDLWVEICRQIYEGELIPKRQADIERAMLEWVTNRGEDVGATTIRPRASKLWKAIGKDEN
jgi:hypothetical protein